MNNLIQHFTKIIVLCLLVNQAVAQISSGGIPISIKPSNRKFFAKENLKPHLISTFNLKKVQEEDRKSPWANRFAAPLNVDYGLNNSGQWTDLENGDRVWRLQVQSKGALALSILYDDFYIPPGGQLFVYSPDKKQMLGAYTNKSNMPNNKFLTGLLKGDQAIVEYFEPASAKGQGRIHIFRVDHAYKREALRDNSYEFQVHAGVNNDTGFGTSFECHENINCNLDPEVQEKKRSSIRIMVIVEEGSGFCTGNLLNNTSVDGKPLVLTAFHCQDGFTPLFDFWKFDFNYESIDCNNPTEEPIPQSLLGSQLLAGRQESDFILLQLISPIPSRFDAFYLGWDRSTTEPDTSMYIHHPFGDIKKIGLINKKAEIFEFPIEWDNDVETPADHHFRVVYTTGYFQPGSSGAALINKAGRFVGQLHGGRSDCSSTTTGFFGRLAMAWEGGGTPATRLKDWLDPLGTETMTLDGTENTGSGEVNLGGHVKTLKGEPLPGVIVTLVGPKSAIDTTDSEGFYQFQELIAGEEYGLKLEKEGFAVNGVNILDMIVIQKHILAIDPLTELPEMLASDVDRSGSISTIDRIKIQKLIMGLDQTFSDVPSWQFLPTGFVSDMPEDPLNGNLPEVFTVENLEEDRIDFDFQAIKSGDVNNSADPKGHQK